MKISLLWLVVAVPSLAQPTLSAMGTVSATVMTPLPVAQVLQVEAQVDVTVTCSATTDVSYALLSTDFRYASAPTESEGTSTGDGDWERAGAWSFSKTIDSFGVRLVPHITFACMQGDHQQVSAWTEALGDAVTVPPLLLLPALHGSTVTVVVFAAPRGDETISLRVFGGGVDLAVVYATAADAMKGIELPGGVSGMVHVTATLLPYGAVSNEVSIELESPTAGPAAPDVEQQMGSMEPHAGCTAGGSGLFPLWAVALSWRRRKKE